MSEDDFFSGILVLNVLKRGPIARNVNTEAKMGILADFRENRPHCFPLHWA